MRWLVAGALGFALQVSAQAAVVIDPLPPVQAGFTARLERFVTLPSTGGFLPRTGAQGLKETGDGSGRLFVNDTRGVLYVTNRSGAAPTPYLDLRTQGIGFSNAFNSSQTGLMSFAFHPNFNRDMTKPGYNVFYTIDTTGAATGTPDWALSRGPVSHHNVLREWTVADPAAPAARILATREVMRVAQPYSDHGPGTIGFDPSARPGTPAYGKLYVGLGDGGSANDPLNSAQDLSSPFGKILRIDPADPDGAGPLDYSVPGDNPFVKSGAGRGEIWAYGLRHPQHFSWDESGQMYISEFGQAQVEEVNLGQAGANYGWPAREGSYGRSPISKSDYNIYDTPNPGLYVDPLIEYDHQEVRSDGISPGVGVSGAFLYEGSLVPELIGKILLSDLVAGRLFYYDPADPGRYLRELLLTLDGNATSFRALAGYNNGLRVDLRMGADANGELYFLTKRDGALFRFALTPVPEPATWAMMLLGFGLVGVAIRTRRRQLPA